MAEPRNIIVFGESGAGKSSVVNMIGMGVKAEVADRAEGVTFEYTSYLKDIRGQNFNVFDTVGLNEGAKGKVDAESAIKHLYKLVTEISDKGRGLSLLVFVMRAPRIKIMTHLNYQMFYEIFCDKAVPIILVVTGLENREDMGEWWTENKKIFDRYGMVFKDVACITATKGKMRKDGTFVYQDEFDQSKEQLEDLIVKHTNSNDTWKLPAADRIADWITNLVNFFCRIVGQEVDHGKVKLAKAKLEDALKIR